MSACCLVGLIAATSALQQQLTPRRAALSGAASTLALVAASRADRAAASPLLLSLGLKRNRAEQKRKYDALESASEVPYYDIVCERGDTECSQRKRRLAREEIDKFKADPGGAAGVFALLALRPLLRLARRDDDEDA